MPPPKFDGGFSSQGNAGVLGTLISCAPQDTNVLVRKYAYTDICRGAVIVVHETQRAALYVNGVREILLSPGRFVCDESANVPVINRLLSAATGGETTYPVELWFVSTTVENNLLWGIRVQVFDSDFSQIINVALSGTAAVRVAGTEIFLDKFVGTRSDFSVEDTQAKIKSWLMTPIRTAAVSAFEACGSLRRFQIVLEDLQAEIRAKLNRDVGSLYGLEFSRFEIKSVESEDFQALIAAERAGTAEQRRLAKLGVDYSTERRFGILEKAAGNEGAGTLMGAGLGLGAGVPLGGMLGGAFSQMFPQNFPAGTQNVSPNIPPILPPASAAGTASAAFYVAACGNPSGPFSEEAVLAQIARGTIAPETLIWCAGMPAWQAAAVVPQFASRFMKNR